MHIQLQVVENQTKPKRTFIIILMLLLCLEIHVVTTTVFVAADNTPNSKCTIRYIANYALTKAGGISVFTRLTNMSLHNALWRVGFSASFSPIASAASIPNEFPLSFNVLRFWQSSICCNMLLTAVKIFQLIQREVKIQIEIVPSSLESSFLSSPAIISTSHSSLDGEDILFSTTLSLRNVCPVFLRVDVTALPTSLISACAMYCPANLDGGKPYGKCLASAIRPRKIEEDATQK